MTTATVPDRPTPTGRGQRAEVAQPLQATLVELIAMGLSVKQVHWTLTGPRFLALHPHLDDIVGLTRRYADTVAERSATIGVPPAGQAHIVASEADLPPVADGWIRDDLAVDELVERLEQLVRRVLDRAALLAELDPVSESILVDLAGDLEMQAWLLRATR